MASHVDESPSYGNAQSQPGKTKSAINKVLSTPEILEMILVQLDMRTLLTSAQLVCYNWANLISESPSIQKALFFTPIGANEWGEEKIINPLLRETFPSFFPTKDKAADHPFDYSSLPMTKDSSTMGQFVRKDASWRKMLVQQPPISDIGLYHIISARGGDSAESSSIPADQKMQEFGYDGVRMERLFELLLFSRDVEFRPYTNARMYWSTREPIEFDSEYRNIKDEFHRLIGKFGVVLYTSMVRQCSMGVYRGSNSEEFIRKEVITAYEEHGFDVSCKEKEIEESKSEVSEIEGQDRRFNTYEVDDRLAHIIVTEMWDNWPAPEQKEN
ncbi:uncharacterized protein N7479_000533 [Penicillium vulpinum]|uniref:F-box domain-containing protein n=1 Tax=Penicillium vulpinum TaxID=29845 RepID=A0A1V6S518_9EURO|nr:uncharacterized protein N7479_000533 [Penicillium vulpinum]KAJ5970615.1 hypothetical protein N7479_000533 [Penicillium vulpinum]OQE09157.1 hypothetical protein PENVUL_c007G06356 [Penicillium vulpinum]